MGKHFVIHNLKYERAYSLQLASIHFNWADCILCLVSNLLRSFASLLPGVGTKVESCSNCLIQNQSAKSIELPAWGKSNSFTFLQQTSCLLSAVSHSFSTSRISRAFLEIFRNLCQGWTSGSPVEVNKIIEQMELCSRAAQFAMCIQEPHVGSISQSFCMHQKNFFTHYLDAPWLLKRGCSQICFYRLNLIFTIVMGCGEAYFGQRGL